MSLFEKLEQATQNRDARGYIDLLSDDCVFVRHQSGTTLNRADMSAMLERMLAEGGMEMGNRRCLYENADILVVHSIIDYADGTREAVLSVYMLEDGKITSLETGATPLVK